MQGLDVPSLRLMARGLRSSNGRQLRAVQSRGYRGLCAQHDADALRRPKKKEKRMKALAFVLMLVVGLPLAARAQVAPAGVVTRLKGVVTEIGRASCRERV